MKPDLNVVLIGYRCTGKSTVGREVASRLGWPFVDTDGHIEAKAGKFIRDIFAARGEEYFRDLESAAIRELCAGAGQVIAVGGGAVTRPENVKNMKQHGVVFLLWADADEIRRRMKADTRTPDQRPALRGPDALSEIRSVLAEREPAYRAAADHVIDTEKLSPLECAARIMQILETRSKHHRSGAK